MWSEIEKSKNAIYKPRLRPYDSVQGLERVVGSLIFDGKKTIDDNKCNS